MPTTGLDVGAKEAGKSPPAAMFKRSPNTDRLCGRGSIRESAAENPVIQDIVASASVPKYREVSTLQQRLQFRREPVPTVFADD